MNDLEKYKNIPSNSHKSKAAAKQEMTEEKAIKGIKGTAKVKKKTGLSKLTDAFISEDASSVKSYIVDDIIIPTFKKLLFDVIHDGAETIIFGKDGSRGKGIGTRANNYVSYNRFADTRYDRRYESNRPKVTNGYQDIIFESRADAEEALCQMGDLIETYGMASISDLYEIANLTTDNFTYNDYGWTSIRSADVVRDRDGYVIKLPRAIPLK